MYPHYAAYLIGCCEGEISLVRPFIRVLLLLPSVLESVAPPLTCAHVAPKRLFHLESCQNVAPERVGPLRFPCQAPAEGARGLITNVEPRLKERKKKKIKTSQNSFVSFTSSPFFSPPPPPLLVLPLTGCEYPASEKSDQTDSQGSVSQRHPGCQSMLVPSCPTMHRARPTLLLLPLLLTLGLLLHLADAQSKCSS